MIRGGKSCQDSEGSPISSRIELTYMQSSRARLPPIMFKATREKRSECRHLLEDSHISFTSILPIRKAQDSSSAPCNGLWVPPFLSPGYSLMLKSPTITQTSASGNATTIFQMTSLGHKCLAPQSTSGSISCYLILVLISYLRCRPLLSRWRSTWVIDHRVVHPPNEGFTRL